MFSNASAPGEFRAGRLPMMMLQERLRQSIFCVALIMAAASESGESQEALLMRRAG